MPEGPEVAITGQYLWTKLKNRTITSVKILSGRYTHQTLKGLDLTKNTNLKIKNIQTKGKFIYFHLTSDSNEDIYLMNTLGLTGRWGFFKDPSSRVKFIVEGDNNKKYNLYFTDPRNFGTIDFTSDKDCLNKKLDKLSPDILKGGLTTQQIIDLINNLIKKTRRDLNLVKVLMDQSGLVSGIGNYLVAEILYNAKLDPHRSLSDLSNDEKLLLAQSMRVVAKTAYYNNTTGYMKHFVNFMKVHTQRIDQGKYANYYPDIVVKTPFSFKVYNKKQDPDGNDVRVDEIVKGRSIYWVPSVQN